MLGDWRERVPAWWAGYASGHYVKARIQLQEFQRRFPWRELPSLTIDQVGHVRGKRDTLTHAIIWGTKALINLGRVNDLGLWQEGGEWRTGNPEPPEVVFERMKSGLFELASLASEERWIEVDERGKALFGSVASLRIKPLYLWFPEALAPSVNWTHMGRTLELLGCEAPDESMIARNRRLWRALREEPAFAVCKGDTLPSTHFFYFDPETRAILMNGSASPVLASPSVSVSEEPGGGDELLDRLRREKNVVLTGPPGTGKTWLAQRAVRLVSGTAGTSHPATTGAVSRVEFVTFHPSFGYEEFVEGIRPAMDEEGEGALRYEVRQGPFLRMADAARAAWERDGEAAPDFLVVVDEINRADVARTFGDLLALLEPSKRLGGPDALEATLPYSGRRLGLSPNLLLLATMNTSDRSVAAMDLALRRRFAFVECAPDPDLLGEVAGVDLGRLLRALNEGIGALLGTDLALGHAFLMGATDAASLEAAWRGRVLPQLSETFHGRTGELEALLGPDLFEDVPLPARLSGRFDAPPRRMRDLRGEDLLAALRGLQGDAGSAG